MPIYAATVVLRRKDNLSHRAVAESIVVVGSDMDSIKRNPDNLRRALRYMGIGPATKTPKQDPERWVIIDVVIIKKLSD